MRSGQLRSLPGGAVSNTGQALRRLGIKTSLCGKVGDDIFGDAILQVLERNGPGLSSGMTVASGDATSYTVVINVSGEDRMFLHAPGCNDTFIASDVPDSALVNTHLLHFGYPTLMARMFEDDGRELEELFQRAKRHGATTSLDVSLPDLRSSAGQADWFMILQRVLPYTDLFLPSIDELRFMLDRDDFQHDRDRCLSASELSILAGQALELGAKVVGVKAGSRGLYLKSRESLKDFGRATPSDPKRWESCELWAPVYEISVQGTTGAGDATIAGLLMGLLRGMDPASSVRAGVAVGACCCEQPDAVTGVRSWEETLRRIESGWNAIELDLPADWQWDGAVYWRV